MSRTRKHKYKRKICNSRRSIYVNKKKMKIKTKSKPRSRRGGGTRKIFKKSHKRYVMKGMKRRIHRGGGKNDHYLKLMALLYDEQDHQWSQSYMKTVGISDYKKFLEVLSKRRMFGLEDGNLSLEELVCSDDDISKKFMTEVRFIKKMKDEGIIVDFEKWKDFIISIRSTISNEERSKNSLDMEDYRILETKQEIYCEKAKTEEAGWLKEEYARICVELATFLTKNAGKFTRGTRSPVVNVDPKLQFNQPRKAIPYVKVESTTLDSSQFEPTLKTYLDYRLSDGRKGSRPVYSDDKIRYFNEKMNDINITLRTTSDPSGKKLYELLRIKELIPVYFEKGGSRDDSVPDEKCSNSVRGEQFRKGIFSSGKHHCRTCGRCMNDSDKKTYGEPGNKLLNPVCIDCYNLFSGTTIAEPGGAAASFSSTSLASAAE